MHTHIHTHTYTLFLVVGGDITPCMLHRDRMRQRMEGMGPCYDQCIVSLITIKVDLPTPSHHSLPSHYITTTQSLQVFTNHRFLLPTNQPNP